MPQFETLENRRLYATDLLPADAGSVAGFYPANNAVLFATYGSNVAKIYSSDGTVAGTHEIDSGLDVAFLGAIGGSQYYLKDGAIYAEDGSSAPRSIMTADSNHRPRLLFDGNVGFIVSDTTVSRIDPTTGLKSQTDLPAGYQMADAVSCAGSLYLLAVNGNQTQVLRFGGNDGQPATLATFTGPVTALSATPNGIALLHTRLTGSPDGNVTELWATDANANLAKIAEGNDVLLQQSSVLFKGPRDAVAASYFVSNGILYRGDGSVSGSVAVTTLVPGGALSSLFVMGPRLGIQMYKLNTGTTSHAFFSSDGTPRGTIQVTDEVYKNSGFLTGPGAAADTTGVYFPATSTGTGTELYHTALTGLNPTLLDDTRPGSGSTTPQAITLWNHKVFYTGASADGKTSGRPYVCDEIATGSISGRVFNDINGNGVFDGATESAYATTVFVDYNNDGYLDRTSRVITTDAQGTYRIDNVPAGTYGFFDGQASYLSQYVLVTVSPGQTTTVNLPYVSPAGYGFSIGRPITATSTTNGFDPALADDGDRATFWSGPTSPNQSLLVDLGQSTDLGGAVINWGNDFPTTYSVQISSDGTNWTTVYSTASGNGGIDSLQWSGTGRYARLLMPAATGGIVSVTDFTLVKAQQTATTLEAESAALSGGTAKQSNHAGYTGSGFADFGGNGSAAQFSYSAAAAGAATLSFRYANGDKAARPLTIFVNGVSVGTIAGTSTGSWDTWQNFTLSANLIAGVNTIKAVAGAATGGNLDSLTITTAGGGTTNPTQPTTFTPIHIDSGGGASGSYSADANFIGGSTYSSTAAIDTSTVTTPAPQAVYQTERFGNFTYSLANLTAGKQYTVTLHFDELYWTAAGQRLFNVTGNGASWLSNFDIFSAAGGKNKAITRSFTATADSNGKIAIVFTSLKDNAKVNAIDVVEATSTTPVTPPSTVTSAYINAGGGASGSFAADSGYSGGSSYSITSAIDTSAVTNAAPQSVYQTERFGNFSYTINNLAPGAAFNVALDYSENYWTSAGQRLFNVLINGTTVATNFDIFAAAGGNLKAVRQTYSATANSSGAITITFVTVKNNAKVDGISITPATT